MKIEFDQIKSDKNLLSVACRLIEPLISDGVPLKSLSISVMIILKPGMLLSDILTTVFIFFVLPRLPMLSE